MFLSVLNRKCAWHFDAESCRIEQTVSGLIVSVAMLIRCALVVSNYVSTYCRSALRLRSVKVPCTKLVTSEHMSVCMFVRMYVNVHNIHGAHGGVVVKVLRYKPAGRGFDSLWCHWNFAVT